MSTSRLIFEFGDKSIYDSIVSSGLLEDSQARDRTTGIDGVVLNYFRRATGIPKGHIFFVSNNYQARVSKHNESGVPAEPEEIFGPAYVFGMTLNTADRNNIEQWLEEAFRGFEARFSGFRRQLTYVGATFSDYCLLSRNSFRDDIEKVLH